MKYTLRHCLHYPLFPAPLFYLSYATSESKTVDSPEQHWIESCVFDGCRALGNFSASRAWVLESRDGGVRVSQEEVCSPVEELMTEKKKTKMLMIYFGEKSRF